MKTSRPSILATSISTALITGILSTALVLPALTHAASDTWTGAVDNDFINAGNWLGGNVPGAPGLGNGNTDTATFNNGVNTAVSLNGDRNLKFITFGNVGPGLGNFALSGSTISFSDNTTQPGFVQVLGNWGSANQTVNSNLLMNRLSGANDFLILGTPGYGGTLTVNGSITTAATANTTQLTTRAGASGGIVLNGGVNDNSSGLVQLSTAATSTGTLTLGGTNTFTGGLVINSAPVVINDVAGAAVLAATNSTTLNNGTLEFRGATSGTTSELTGTLLSSGTSSNRIILNPNGGSGVTVEVSGLGTAGATAAPVTRIELGAGSVFRTTNALPVDSNTANVHLRNSIVVGTLTPATANSGRAGFIVQDTTGVGFATQNASNEIVRYTSATALVPTVDEGNVGSTATNYVLSSTLVKTAAFSFSTLQLDTSASAVTLDMGANNFNATASATRGLLITGANGGSITSSTGTLANSLYLHNYSTGAFTFNVAGNVIISAGTGFTTISKTPTADLYVAGSLTRLSLDANYTAGTLRIYDGGVLELGADLNGATAGDFSRILAVAPAAGQVGFFGSGGFSAFTATPNGTRVVNLGNAGATVAWGAGGFVSSSFVLSSSQANATLEFVNPINLSGQTRVFDVRNGSATVDARLTGAITDSGAGATVVDPNGIYKTGAGTLELGNADNTYDGNTEVAAGRLLVSGSLSGTTALITSGGTIELGAANLVVDTARVKLEGGMLATGGFSETVGALTLAASSTFDLGAGASVFTFANSAAETWTGTLSIANWSGSTAGGGIDQIFFGIGGLTGAQIAAIQFVNPENFAPGIYGAQLLGTGEVVLVPEPGIAISLLGGIGLLLGLRRRRN